MDDSTTSLETSSESLHDALVRIVGSEVGHKGFRVPSLLSSGEICARTHGECARNHANHACEHNDFAVSQGGAGNSRDDAEDGTEPVGDIVDGVPDPASRFVATCCLAARSSSSAFLAWPGEKRGERTAIADQVIECLIVLAFVLEHLPKDDKA